MKRNTLITLLVILTGVLGLGLSSFDNMYPNGAPAGYTGSPGDNKVCTECHGGTATTTNGLITSNIPAAGYTPGQTYTITATNTLTGSGKYGFELSPQNASGAQLGTLVAGAGTKLVSGSKYITHSNANSTTNSWTFSWIAPAAGTGNVTFYGAFAKNKPGPVTKSTLTVQEAAAQPGPAGPITGPVSVCKNTTETYSVGAITGATGYVWTVPAGATISGGQGSTSVSVFFGNSAVSGNIVVFGTNAAGNGASSQLAVTVGQAPSVPSVPSGPSQVDLNAVVTSTYTTGSGLGTYAWQITPAAAGTISGSTETATVTWNSSFLGNAEISVKASNNCGESAWSPVKTTEVINTTGLSEDRKAFLITDGDAPGSFVARVNIAEPEARLIILDLSGRMRYSVTIGGRETRRIDHNLNPGIYLVIVETAHTVYKQKVLAR